MVALSKNGRNCYIAARITDRFGVSVAWPRLFEELNSFFFCFFFNFFCTSFPFSRNVGRDGANINIPIGDNLLSMLPTANSIDFSIVSQIDSATLEQLRMLQKNLDIIVNKASAN